jgi:hypothetical protein
VKQIDYMSQQDLTEIVERASTVEERLSGDFSPAEGDEALVDERLEAWCQALGKGEVEGKCQAARNTDPRLRSNLGS